MNRTNRNQPGTGLQPDMDRERGGGEATLEFSGINGLTTVLWLLALQLLLLSPALSAGTLSFTYNSAGRLVGLNVGTTNVTYTYDGAGNLLNRAAFTSANADLALTQSASSDVVARGSILTLTLSVANLGGITATSVELTNSLSPNATLIAVTSSQGTIITNGNTLICDLGTLNAGASVTVTVQVRLLNIGVLTSVASAGATTPDPITANNNSTLTVSIGPQPTLTLSQQNSGLVLAWPYVAQGYVLEATPSFSPVNWSPTPVNWTTPDGIVYLAPVNPQAAEQFFRLRAP